MRARRFALWAALAAAACGPSNGAATDYRAATQSFSMRISSDPVPPHARERITFKLVVRDKNSGQPIEGGEGRIYANNRQGGGKTWDSFVAAPAPGTYYANLYFVTAENYAMGLQFRRASTDSLETVDWVQEVRPERPAIP
ncbi:MAG TPA: hypothetical protein VEI06_15490 [Gemmatimonadaceae bacterium]|nr:hypothetical protein [Gemmatimonadaceae bacterium]